MRVWREFTQPSLQCWCLCCAPGHGHAYAAHGEAYAPVLIDKDTEIHCATGVDVGMEEGWDKLQFWRIEGVVYFESYLAFIEASLVGGGPHFPRHAELPEEHICCFPSVSSVFGLAQKRTGWSSLQRFSSLDHCALVSAISICGREHWPRFIKTTIIMWTNIAIGHLTL